MAKHEDSNRDLNKYVVRFPPGMRDEIAKSAKKSGRSMNAEIVASIEHALKFDEAYSHLRENYQILLHQQLGHQNAYRNQANLTNLLTRILQKLQDGVPKKALAELSALIKKANASSKASIELADAIRKGIENGKFEPLPTSLTDYMIGYLESKEEEV